MNTLWMGVGTESKQVTVEMSYEACSKSGMKYHTLLHNLYITNKPINTSDC
jgi:hypothetical protein